MAAHATVDSLSRSRERVRVRARALRRSSPDAERALWQALRGGQLDGRKFRRQRPISGYFADFACIDARLVIEIDGGQHFDAEAVDADGRRTACLAQPGFHVLRLTNRQVLVERDAVPISILNWLTANHPHPNPLPPAGEGVEKQPLPPAGEGVKRARTEP